MMGWVFCAPSFAKKRDVRRRPSKNFFLLLCSPPTRDGRRSSLLCVRAHPEVASRPSAKNFSPVMSSAESDRHVASASDRVREKKKKV
jgi:hypothetical protein